MRYRCQVRLITALCTVAGLLALGAPAQAQVPLNGTYGGTQGFGTQCLSANDDGSSNAIDLTPAFPNGLNFFTGVHTTAYVNTNGNITFSGGVSTFTPNAGGAGCLR